MAGMKQRAIDIYNWFEQRLGLGTVAIQAAEHQVPSSTSSWWYVFGRPRMEQSRVSGP